MLLMSIFFHIARVRGILSFVLLIVFALCGYINGFMTSRTLKFFQIGTWKQSALMTSVIFPCFILLTLSMGDIAEKIMGSSAALVLSEGLLHYLIWWVLDAPCAVFGAYRGFT